ncbi:MAG: hypothetical protein ABIR11_04995 [Candidatus Limnocylindrales bacterium]
MTLAPLPSTPVAPAGPGGLAARLAGLLRFEDVLMGAFALIGLPLLDRLLGSRRSGTPAEPTFVVGLFGLVAIAGVIACLATRGPDERPPLEDSAMTLQGWARFPLAAGVGIVGVRTLPGLGLDEGPVVGITFLVVFVTALLFPSLPVVAVPVRRVLVTPMALIAAGAFNGILGDGLNDLVGGFVRGSSPPEVGALWPLILAAIGMLYVMLVVAPRSIADPGASGVAWLARFGFLLLAVALGAAIGI